MYVTDTYLSGVSQTVNNSIVYYDNDFEIFCDPDGR
jgi:hypothetical protein